MALLTPAYIADCVLDLNEFDLGEIVKRRAHNDGVNATDLRDAIIAALPTDHPDTPVDVACSTYEEGDMSPALAAIEAIEDAIDNA